LAFVGRGKREKLDADAMRTGPTHDGTLNENRGLASGKDELEVHYHTGECREGALDAAAFARKV
jgi:hypothetical protein